jgi:Amt family ammonium transporter
VPLRVSDLEEEQGLDASQHNENYVQGTLLVSTRKGLVEEELHPDSVYESTTVNGSGYHP